MPFNKACEDVVLVNNLMMWRGTMRKAILWKELVWLEAYLPFKIVSTWTSWQEAGMHEYGAVSEGFK